MTEEDKLSGSAGIQPVTVRIVNGDKEKEEKKDD